MTFHQCVWPVLTRYDHEHLTRIALPLGGIGTGTVSLGGRGNLRDWEIVNRPAKGFAPQYSFFAIRAQSHGSAAITKALEGPLDPVDYEGHYGGSAPNSGLPRFRHASFEGAYPLGQVLLHDDRVPLQVRIEAFNPLVPGDSERSGIPVAVLRFVLENPGDLPVDASVCGSVQNFIGHDGLHGVPSRNVNTFRSESVQGIFMRSDGVEPEAEQWGTLALSTTARKGISYRTSWARLSWSDTLLDFWDDFSADGALDERAAEGIDAPMGSLTVQTTVAPGESAAVTFLLTWHFPNRRSWDALCQGGICNQTVPVYVGNHYATRYADAWEVATHVGPQLAELEADTVQFVSAFCSSDLPDVVKEAALYNLSTLRSQTCFRTADNRFYGWEGSDDHTGSCHGSSTHVWNYEQATAFLFGDLARSMREIEFAHATDERGLMSFRVNLPIERATEWGVAAADGQMGCIMKLYREWQLCGDDRMLRSLWPHARRALEFCWIPGGWDADRDGVMEGCQHNTMDVEYFGPNPQMEGWYLGALRACEAMARYLGEDDFAATCRSLFEHGQTWTDAHLFNGEYYEHDIRPPANPAVIAPGLGLQWSGAVLDLREPEMQLGAGCLVDQLVGQYMAHICGLGYLLDPAHVRDALQSVMRYNFRHDFSDHFNHMRSFVLNDEAGLLMCAYPHGGRPIRPFPYFTEVMTGFEYTAAIGMLYEGLTEEALVCISAIRARYDGRKRSPFNEAECGYHYARAMASWGAVIALSGFQFSAVEQTIAFQAVSVPSQYVWSNGIAWGVCRQTPRDGGSVVELTVLRASITLRQLELTGLGMAVFDPPCVVGVDKRLVVDIDRNVAAS